MCKYTRASTEWRFRWELGSTLPAPPTAAHTLVVNTRQRTGTRQRTSRFGRSRLRCSASQKKTRLRATPPIRIGSDTARVRTPKKSVPVIRYPVSPTHRRCTAPLMRAGQNTPPGTVRGGRRRKEKKFGSPQLPVSPAPVSKPGLGPGKELIGEGKLSSCEGNGTNL